MAYDKTKAEIETAIGYMPGHGKKASDFIGTIKYLYLSGHSGIAIDEQVLNEAVNERGYSKQGFIKEQVDEAENKLGTKPINWGYWNVEKGGAIFNELNPTGRTLGINDFVGHELFVLAEKEHTNENNFHGFFNIYIDWCAFWNLAPSLYWNEAKTSYPNNLPQEIIDNGGVYLISDGYNTKVGYCGSSPFKRLSEIQVGNPQQLFVAGAIPGDKDNEEFCRNKLEKEGYFKKNGEWLKGDPVTMMAFLERKGQRVFSNIKK